MAYGQMVDTGDNETVKSVQSTTTGPILVMLDFPTYMLNNQSMVGIFSKFSMTKNYLLYCLSIIFKTRQNS